MYLLVRHQAITVGTCPSQLVSLQHRQQLVVALLLAPVLVRRAVHCSFKVGPVRVVQVAVPSLPVDIILVPEVAAMCGSRLVTVQRALVVMSCWLPARALAQLVAPCKS